MFDQGVGREVVHTVGSRFFGDTGAWSWNFEGAFRTGTFAGGDVAAWGVGGEVAYRFRKTPLRLQIGFAADVVSGDDDPDDADLGTFNPMFPSGKYLHRHGAAQPRLRTALGRDPTACRRHRVADRCVLLAREHRRRDLYDRCGLLRSGDGSDARFVGTELELAVDWQATPELNLSASVSAVEPGRFIRDTRPADRIGMIGAAANFRF